MRRYETVFILRPDLGEPAQKEAVKRFQGIIGSAGGDLIDTDEWGFRDLAYRIKGERRGFYVRLDYGGNGATLNEIERNLKLSDSVLRHLSVLVATDADPAKVRAEIEAHRRRAAEARAAAEAKAAAAAAAAAERTHAAEQAREEREHVPEHPHPDTEPAPSEAAQPAPAVAAEATQAADPVVEAEAPAASDNVADKTPEPESGSKD